MTTQIYLRLAAYVFTIAMHVLNIEYIKRNTQFENFGNDPEIQVLKETLFRYLTIWTVCLQIFYAFFGLFCDAILLLNSKKKNYKLPGLLGGFRNVLFGAFVYPSSMVVATVFWSVFIYDRELIFPKFVDKVVPVHANHILHTAIIPIALWEAWLRPRPEPKSHARYICYLIAFFVAYLYVLYSTYFKYGVWLYPMFKKTQGTIHFVLIHLYVTLIALFYYYSQWWINYWIHGAVVKRKIQ